MLKGEKLKVVKLTKYLKVKIHKNFVRKYEFDDRLRSTVNRRHEKKCY